MGDEQGLDKELVRQALAEQPGEWISVRRPGRPGATLTRTIAEWFVNDAGPPDEADLDALFEGATRVRALERLSVWGEALEGETCHADVTDLAALRALRETLRHRDLATHLLMPGDLVLEVSGPEGLRATLVVIRLSLLRWERWKTDAQLAGGLGEWIAAHGSDAPLLQARAEWARAEAEAEADARDALVERLTAVCPDLRSSGP